MEYQPETKEEDDVYDLDKRKLTLIFFGFLVICGCFFVAGYILGDGGGSQTVNDAVATAGSSKANDNPGAGNRMNETINEPVPPPPAVIEPSPATPKTFITDTVIPAVSAPPATSAPSVSVDNPKPQPKETPATTAPKTNPSVKQVVAPTTPPAGTVYSVQVAAFRARREVETKAKELEARGFNEYRIELPQSSNDFYRLRVGSFATRAEAVEMAERLRQSGFDIMISESRRN